MPPAEINPHTEPFRDPHSEGLATLGAQRVAALSWTDDDGPHEFTLEGPTTVGSAPSCKVRVADAHVSRVHLEMSPTDAGLVIRDLGSKNGTFLGLNEIHHFTARTDVRIRLGGRVEIQVQHRADPVDVPLWRQSRYGQLIGRSAIMRRVFDQLSRLASNDETVLIQGESGTGKELAASAIHEHSKRRRKPYVIVDCGALSPQLVESELFGHARGAFTGAVQSREGAFEAANGGTLFLDEIGELPLEMQPKLLRVLEARTIRRVGETEYRPVDVRVIAASLKDLREMVNRGAFREDLYFRLAVIPLRMPCLREHLEDLPLYIDRYLDGQPDVPQPTGHILTKLMHLPWLGNVRDVRGVVARAAMFGWARAIDGDDESAAPPAPAPEVISATASAADEALGPGGEVPSLKGNFYDARRRNADWFEREYMKRNAAKYPNDIYEAAVHAGLDQTYLRKLRKKWGV